MFLNGLSPFYYLIGALIVHADHFDGVPKTPPSSGAP